MRPLSLRFLPSMNACPSEIAPFVSTPARSITQSNPAFSLPVPAVDEVEAALAAQLCYGLQGTVRGLTGERDKNFCVSDLSAMDGSTHGLNAITLKFINPGEPLAETAMQIAVLQAMQGGAHMAIPMHLAPVAQQHALLPDTAVWPSAHGPHYLVRAYSYLHGNSGNQLQHDPIAWESLGSTVGALTQQLAQFQHQAAKRDFLWDVCRAPELQAWLPILSDEVQKKNIQAFWRIFTQRLQAAWPQLPKQVIHSDLSPSNTLVSADGLQVTGVIDFGDMLWSPRIAELGIAVSYPMALSSTPLEVLTAMQTGYARHVELLEAENELLLDFVIARLTQRMVITAWRAAAHPENAPYILRSQAPACQLFDQLIEPWLLQHCA